jgi:hypothetical protein
VSFQKKKSSWGKFVQRQELPTSKFVKTKLELARIQNDRTKDILDVHLINSDIIALDLVTKTSYLERPKFQSDIIGVFVCAYGRCLLYKTMEKLGPQRLLYCDTDSVLYIERPGDRRVKTGQFLGHLTDEVPPGLSIRRFCASAPKTYALSFSDGSQQVKMKGLSLHYLNKEKFTFDVIRKTVLGELKSVESVTDDEFRRVKYRGIVYKRPFVKTYRMTFTKRVIVHGRQYSIPYGFNGELW